MKKRHWLAFIICTSNVFAQSGGFIDPIVTYYSSGGFQGPPPAPLTVEQAKTLKDKTWVVLEGYLVRQIGHDIYQFKDNSGELFVDIEPDRWQGQTVTPKSRVRLDGELNKDCHSIQLEVKKLKLLP